MRTRNMPRQTGNKIQHGQLPNSKINPPFNDRLQLFLCSADHSDCNPSDDPHPLLQQFARRKSTRKWAGLKASNIGWTTASDDRVRWTVTGTISKDSRAFFHDVARCLSCSCLQHLVLTENKRLHPPFPLQRAVAKFGGRSILTDRKHPPETTSNNNKA